ncbi:MAG TPA: BON domain-containing protein [Usitatibacter sp.]|nr:BON domain-containing protein [Usitatibacter sp.]
MKTHRKIAVLALAAALGTPALAAELVDLHQAPPPSTTETYYYVTEGYSYAPAYPSNYVAPAGRIAYVEPTVTYVEPPVTVYAPLLTEDEAITEDVMDSIVTDPRLSGRVGVETFNRNVTLSGHLRSSRQVDIAASNARSVPGVIDVENRIRPRVGGSY